MIKRHKAVYIALTAVAVCSGFLGSNTFAGEQVPSNTIARVKTECPKIKQSLKRLRSDDALKRVNLGQNYEYISDKLMANLNTRIAANKLNGGKLIEKTSELNENVTYFRENYQKYERELTKLSEVDCGNNASDFYKKLDNVRYLRSELNYNTKKISEITKEYKTELDEFKKGLK